MSKPAAYKFKRKPRLLQANSLRVSLREPVWAHFHEMRCGKTKVVLDTAAYHYEIFAHKVGWPPGEPMPGTPAPAPKGARQTLVPDATEGISALLVVAMPSGVPAQWVLDEVPKDVPDRIPRRCLIWNANKVKTKAFEREWKELLAFKGLAILAVNAEATITKAFRTLIVQFLKERKRVMAVYDESSLSIKTPGADRTRMAIALRKRPEVVIRRILDGTPYGERPLDFFAQFAFLDPKILGHESFYTFKAHFSILEKHTARRINKSGEMETYQYDHIAGYRNLDELHARIAAFSDRVRFRDISNSPEPIYSNLRFDLTPEQRRVYIEMETNHKALLRTGETVSATHVLTRKLRLQQITSNIMPTDVRLEACPQCQGTGGNAFDCEPCEGLGAIPKPGPVRRISDKNPRLDTLRENIELDPHTHNLIWARFSSDIDDIMAMLRHIGRRPVQYDGRVNAAAKVEAKNLFQAGEFTDLVGNQNAAGRGLRLTRAECHYFYSNTYSLITREQTEFRAEDADKTAPTRICDLMATDSEDEIIVSDLREKRTLSEIVMRESRGKWI